MKPVILIGVAVAAVLGIAAIAFAASGGGGDNDAAAQVASPTPADSPTQQPAASPTPGNAGSVPGSPGGGINSNEKPIPVEPDGGVGTTPPDAPGGDTSVGTPDQPVSDNPVTDKPIPSEPPFTVTPAPAQPSLPAGRYAEAAPIDEVDVSIAESFPPQYFVHIVAGLPSGCAEQYTHAVTRTGNVIEIEVLNSFPVGNPVCTAIYGMYELNIGLGSDFVSGETYTVSVNGGAAEKEFVAQ